MRGKRGEGGKEGVRGKEGEGGKEVFSVRKRVMYENVFSYYRMCSLTIECVLLL